MKLKILTFVYDGSKFLALRNNPKDLFHGGDFWFTVTGSVETGEMVEEAIKREVKEETGLIVDEIFDLNWGSIYSWRNKDYQEKNFISFVEKNKVVLNKEHIDFAWLGSNDFINKIKWELDKLELKAVLNRAIKKERFFKKLKIDDFRKK